MNMKCAYLVAFGAAVVLTPSILIGQMDPNGNLGPAAYPQSPQGINQPAAGQSGASTPAIGGQTNQTSSMRDSLGAPGQTGQEMLDKQFVRFAAQVGMADLKFATLATQKASPDVKEMAQKLADDHASMNKDLEAVADQMGVMLPKKLMKDDQAEYEKLNGLSGKDFDTEYLTYIVKAHYQALHSFYMEASTAATPELSTEVVKSMGMMHQHLGLITNTAKNEQIILPPRPPRPAPQTAKK
jgi:putative membrane protein